MPLKPAVGDSLHDVLEPHERRHRHLDPLRDVLPRDFDLGPASLLAHLRGERDADAGLAIAIAQPPNAELADRDEACHAEAAPRQHRRVAVKLELPEGQGQRPISQVDLDRLRFCRGAAGRHQATVSRGRRRRPRERQAQAEVVEIGGQPRARVEGVVDRAVLPEQEGIGVDGGGQVVVPAVFLLGVDEGQFGQREEAVAAEPGALATHFYERRGGILVEALGEPEAMEELLRRGTGLAVGQHAPRDGAVDLFRTRERDADRRGTRARQEQDTDLRDEREGST